MGTPRRAGEVLRADEGPDGRGQAAELVRGRQDRKAVRSVRLAHPLVIRQARLEKHGTQEEVRVIAGNPGRVCPVRCIEHPKRARVITPFIGRQLEICEAFGFTPPENCGKDCKSRKVTEGRKRGRPRKPAVVSDL